MAIKEPGHGLIMIRRVRAHDRGLCACMCALYLQKYESKMSGWTCNLHTCMSVISEQMEGHESGVYARALCVTKGLYSRTGRTGRVECQTNLRLRQTSNMGRFCPFKQTG